MRILIYGAGIIGCTYGWQLSKADHNITVLVRKGKKEQILKDGIPIHCTDYRDKRKAIEEVIFRPEVIEELSSDNTFEYIIVSTNCTSLKEVLPVLSRSAGSAHILFFQNIWGEFDEIAKWLSPDKYFFGFPFMAGGGKEKGVIYSGISGIKQSCTPLGELNGEITPRVKKMAEALDEAKLRPVISSQIKTWLITHYAVAAGLSAGIMKTGNGKKFASDPIIIKEAIKAIREGFRVCMRRGINPKKEKANKLYYLPLFISIPIAKKVYGSETLCLFFDGHTRHSPDEMKKMLKDILEYGETHNLQMPYLKNFESSLI